MRLSARSDPKPKFGGPAQPPPHSGGRLPGRVCPVGPLSIVPRILAGGCLAPPSGRRRDGKVQSARWASRKGAFWTGDVTEKRILGADPHGKAHSACGQSRRVHLSVTCRLQNALFRRVRLSSPGQTRRRLTERRILQPPAHVKAQSAPAGSRKTALCAGDATST